ncbi:unnamed protein product [Clavelina lepadiformis]|uniref:Uncharacterized protein n=1 Tax=Clavelina lepadiformis TaxID=159417 RepID=A0ABP0F330_CLALP
MNEMIWSNFCVIHLAFILGLCLHETNCLNECKSDTLGLSYAGSVSTSLNGRICQHWSSSDPWCHIYYTDENIAQYGMEENYCRNPDMDPGGPWCIVSTLDDFWEYCDVPDCVNECTDNIHNCHRNATCIDLDIGFSCSCNELFVGSGTSCSYECVPNPCGDRHHCISVDNIQGYTCNCIEGFIYDGDTCIGINECSVGSHNCHPNATCTNLVDGFICTCNKFFVGDGTNCTYVCEPNPCGEEHECVAVSDNVQGYTCKCAEGYFYDNITCIEINGCSVGSHNCHPNATCTDLVDGFNCTCNEFFIGDGTNCTYVCEPNPCGEEHECVALSDNVQGYSCKCADGYFYDNITCIEINGCSVGSHKVCHPNATCNDLVDGFNCTCNEFFSGDGTNCTYVCEPRPCGEEHECVAVSDNVQGYTCKCADGYFYDNITCIEINGCSVGSHNCHPNATCTDLVDGFNCTCNEFFIGDGTNCTYVCEPNPCGEEHECVAVSDNVQGYSCNCAAGHLFDGRTCKKVCEPNPCGEKHKCIAVTDDVQGYACSCAFGYFYNSITCIEINDCSVGFHNCHANATCIVLEDGFNCTCNEFFHGDGVDCEFTCEPNPCGEEHECVAVIDNVQGYSCKCAAGHLFNGRTCKSNDKCANGSRICHQNATCTNLENVYSCICDRFFQGNGTICTFVCEQNPCGHLHECLPDASSSTEYVCNCHSNYSFNGITCIDPCQPNPCGDLSQCVVLDDTILGYACVCNIGFTKNGNTCVDIDECNQPNQCIFGNCTNTIGSFQCNCFPGFTGKSCTININECSEDPCDPNAQCIDSTGSYSCVCSTNFCGDGFTCHPDLYITLAQDNRLDDNVAIRITTQIPIPFGNERFQFIYVHKNGLIYFTNAVEPIRRLNNFNQVQNHQTIAPFWDVFVIDEEEGGNVFWQVFSDSAGLQPSEDPALARALLLQPSDFTPLFLLIVEWRNVIPHPIRQFGDYPSTFQCILASDGSKTYVWFIYSECRFQWVPQLTGSGAVVRPPFIGFINSNGETRVPINERAPYEDSNIGLLGTYQYSVSDNLTSNREGSCLDWCNSDSMLSSLGHYSSCPWAWFHARRDRRWTRSPGNLRQLQRLGLDTSVFYPPGIVCYQLRFPSIFFPSYTGPLCCYDSNLGRFEPLYSRFQRTQIPSTALSSDTIEQLYNSFLQTDYQPERDCCTAGSYYCDLFRQKRPTASTILYFFPRIRFTFGDPHLQTVYGDEYTFNDLGEYILLRAPNEFELQGRMALALDVDQNPTKATVFSALVAKDFVTDNLVLFEPSNLHANQTNVSVNGSPIVFSDELNLQEALPHILYQRTSDVNYEVTFSPNITITVFTIRGVLGFSLSVSDDFRDRVKGLLGTFETPSGTVLNTSDFMLNGRNDLLEGTFDQEKVYNYGKLWKLPEDESLFVYPSDTNYSTFNPDNHTPPFLTDLIDDLTQEEYNNLKSTCSSSLSCMFDLAVTKDIAAAMVTGEIAKESADNEVQSDNSAPVITWEGEELRLIANHFTTAQFIATDNNSDSLTFTVTSLPGISINDSGILTANIGSDLFDIAANSTSAQLIVYVSDGLVESQLVVPLLICDCSGKGQCLWRAPPRYGQLEFKVVNCECDEAYDGESCQFDFNACFDSPCFTNCTDAIAPAVGFTCQPCPSSLEGDGISCLDIDECNSSAPTHNCEQICRNIFMGYECDCFAGYRRTEAKVTEHNQCEDIDECSDVDPCGINAGCSNTNGSFTCFCQPGFVNSPESNCVDINECENASLSHCPNTTLCMNTAGSFRCDCLPGLTRFSNANEQSECISSNCSLIDPCVNALCNDSSGSIACDCLSGHRKQDDAVCININECDEDDIDFVQLCSSNQLCIDTVGGFTCADGSDFLATIVTRLKAFSENSFIAFVSETTRSAVAVKNVTFHTIATNSNEVQVRFTLFEVSQLDAFLTLRAAIASNLTEEFHFREIPIPLHRPISEVCGKLQDSGTQFTEKDIITKVTCQPHMDIIALSTCNVSSLGISPDSLSMGSHMTLATDPSCRPLIFESPGGDLFSTFIVFNKADRQCGVEVTVDNTSITYLYTVASSGFTMLAPIVRYRPSLEYRTQCVFVRNLFVTSHEYAYVKNDSETSRRVKRSLYSLTMYSDEEALVSLDDASGNQPIVRMDDVIYYRLHSADNRSGFNPQVKDCWVTPTSDPFDSTRQNVLRDGCSLDKKPRRVPSSNLVTVSLASIFWLSDDRSLIYLHCSLLFCDITKENCFQPLCRRRSRRASRVHVQLATSAPLQTTSPCRENNRCSQICSYKRGRMRCSCSEGYKLQKDFVSCKFVHFVIKRPGHSARTQNTKVGNTSHFHQHPSHSKIGRNQARVALIACIAVAMFVTLSLIFMFRRTRESENYERLSQ